MSQKDDTILGANRERGESALEKTLDIVRRVRRMLHRPSSPPVLRSAQAYSLWASSYPPHAHNDFMAVEQQALLGLLPPLTNCRVLDLACGSGRYAQIALDRGAAEVVGVDNSLAMLREGTGFPRLRAEMTALPFRSATFDVLICGLATGHLPPTLMRGALVEMARVVRTGGTAIFSDVHPYLFLNGARRTFIASDGRTHAVEHYPHLITDYFRAACAAGFTVSDISEAQMSTNGRDMPVVLAIAVRSVGQHG